MGKFKIPWFFIGKIIWLYDVKRMELKEEYTHRHGDHMSWYENHQIKSREARLEKLKREVVKNVLTVRELG